MRRSPHEEESSWGEVLNQRMRSAVNIINVDLLHPVLISECSRAIPCHYTCVPLMSRLMYY